MDSIDRVKKAIEEFKKGNIIIMVDDEDRENEGDLVYPATFSTPEKVNFLAKEGRGLICVALTNSIAERLDLKPMVQSNTSSYETAFTISVDAKECETGISAYERDLTIKILASSTSKADDLVRPGHIFPLIAKDGGTLVRTGHTEGSVDLCKLAGISSSAVICEIMKDDGTMARRDDLDKFGKKHNLHTVYISDIVEYRLQNEKLIKLISSEKIDMLGSQADKYIFQDHLNREHIAIRFYQPRKTANVRFHHIGLDVDLITNSKKYQMLMKSTNYLIKNSGVLIFLNSSENSGENIKEFGIGAQILKELGISEIKLIQESKREIEFVGIQGFGLNLKEVINL